MSAQERRTFGGLTTGALVWIVVGGVLLAAFFYLLTTLGPRTVDHPEVPEALNAEQWKLSLEIGAIERRYQKHNPKRPPPPTLREDLTRAIAMQKQILRINPKTSATQSVRLEELEKARDTVIAWEAWPRVEALEEQLRGELADSERVQVLSEALAARREINQSRASVRYKDLAKETQLERELIAAQAGPMKAEVEEIWKRGRVAMKEEDWVTALESYRKARELMDEVNAQFARTRFSDVGFRAQLWATELSLQGANESTEVDVLEKGAIEALVGEDRDRAADYYMRAVTLQGDLNRQWPQSRFASSVRLDSLETKRQAILAESLLIEARELDLTATKLLAQRRTLGASDRIEVIHEIMTRFTNDYPRSDIFDEGLVKKYTYLMTIRADLRELQDALYERLVPLHDDESRMVMRGSMDQKTYVKMMRFNPSRTQGDGVPVDSVNWSDAREFCRRLGWVLGRAVRLPSAQVMQQIQDDPATKRSGMAEWLDTADASETAPVYPASSGDAAQDIKVSSLDKKTQAAGLGFRVMVVWEPQPPAQSK